MLNDRNPSDEPPNYTGGRKLETLVVKESTASEDGQHYSIHTMSGTGFSVKASVGKKLKPGTTFELETQGWSKITGFKVKGIWIERATDDDLKREYEEFVARLQADRRKRLEDNRLDWSTREAALPRWLRERLLSFHSSGGATFEEEGWGYELIICEMAALMDATMTDAALAAEYGSSDSNDSIEVADYCKEQGVSGNQYGFARALVRMHRKAPHKDMAGTVSALTRLTGDPNYSGAEE